MESNWSLVALAAAVVFVFQLLRPWLAKPFQKLKTGLPTLPSSPAKSNKLLVLLILAAAVIWPFFAGRSSVDIATMVLIYVMLGLGLNIVVGFAGLLDLGFVGFYAVGAYTYALLYHWGGWSFWEALPFSGAMAALFGFILGFPVLRLRGDYGHRDAGLRRDDPPAADQPEHADRRSGRHLGHSEAVGVRPEMTRRASTEGGTTFHDFFGLTFQNQHMVIYLYMMALLLALVTLFVSTRLIRMPVGRAWEALREDEIACRSLGLNPTRIKLSAFTLGATFAGFGGAFFAARQGMVNPESFTFIESALILAIVVLGGMGSQVGVIRRRCC